VHHKVASTAAEAAALAVKHGCDLDCGATYAALLEAVKQGLILESDIDLAVTRLFTARFRLGMFDPPEQVPFAQIPYEIIDSPQHRALALQAARESIVLLQNKDDLLPLPKDISSIAVVGPNADHLSVLMGNYNGTPAEAATPLEGIRKKLSASTKLYYAQGCCLVDGAPPIEVVPSAYLRPAEADAGATGLTAAYHANADREGEPALIQVDRVVDFIWKDTTPLTKQPADAFSILWTGYLVPPVSGRYQLGVDACSGYKLYLDGELLVDYESVHHPALRSREVMLEGGRFHPLRLEFFSHGLDPQARLLWARPDTDYEAQALAAAEKADVIVAVMGISPRLEGEEMSMNVDGFEGGDRTSIDLPPVQEELLKRLNSLGKPLVLVLLNGSALALTWASEHISAIVEAWYPGQAGGDALADVLFGDYNPGGRLPITFYRSVDDLPPFDEYRMEGRTYRYFRGQPLFAFGHGLSYTQFRFDNLQISRARMEAGDRVTVGCDVTNSGDCTGDEVVQLYIRHRQARAPRAIQELKGFARIALEPGQRKRVTFVVHTDLLALHDEDGCQVVEPGTIDLMLGSASDCLPLTGQLEIIGDPVAVGRAKIFFSEAQVE
jgi:beta-glucosidase